MTTLVPLRRPLACVLALALAAGPAGFAPALRAQVWTGSTAPPASTGTAATTGTTAPTTAALPPRASPALPDLGESAQTILSPGHEKRLGDAMLKQLRATGGYMDDPEVNDYLQELGQRIVAARPDPRYEFTFFAVPDPTVNAFAMPGGYIGVNTGLILLTQSESELASVLAHEISHVTQNHMARMLAGQQNALLMSLAALAVALVAASSKSSSANEMASAAVASSQALAVQNQINYTREHEYEADRIGFQRLEAAGFDVNGAAGLMDRMQKATRFADGGNTPSYLRTHPVTYERIAEAQSRAQSRPYRQVADSLDFHMVRALLRSYVGRPHEAVAWFDAAIAERKFNSEVAVRYGLVAALLRDRQYERAKRELAALEKFAPPHPMIEAIAGHVLMDSGQPRAAVARIEVALARYPNKMQLVYDYGEALVKAGRPADASAFLEKQLQRFPGDGSLHRIAAKAYAEQHKRLQHHYHQGEYYAWLGSLRGAIDQMEIAIKAGDANFYESSIVETRLRALRREMAEQQKEGFGRTG